MLIGGAVLTLMGAFSGEPIPNAFPVRPVLAMAYLVVFGSIIAFSAYGYLLRQARPALATSYAYVNPVVAVALGVLLANERLTSTSLLAMPAILIGVIVVMLAQGRRTGDRGRE